MDTSKLVKVYLKMRDKRTELKRAYEEEDNKIKAGMDKIEAQLLKFLNESGLDNSTIAGVGTFYRQEEVTPTGSDWEAFYDWIKKNDAFDALERRIKKTFIKEYAEAHNGAIPPGVSVYREYVVRVRRGK